MLINKEDVSFQRPNNLEYQIVCFYFSDQPTSTKSETKSQDRRPYVGWKLGDFTSPILFLGSRIS